LAAKSRVLAAAVLSLKARTVAALAERGWARPGRRRPRIGAVSYYRALISVPISATSDVEAEEIATAHANSLLHPGSDVVADHVERLVEARDGSVEIVRVVREDPLLYVQLPRRRAA
jgi:hypothetical protein